MNKNVTIVHSTHPRADDIFRAHAIPREILKANRSTFRVVCTNLDCMKLLDKLQTCQKCKSVWYCSRGCQTTDWSRHKKTCIPVERSSGVLKLIQTFVSNITLFTHLATCAVFDLDLLNNRKRIGVDVPFMACVDVGIEPAEAIAFTKLLYTDEPVPDKLQGMIQVNNFFSWIPGQSGYDPLTPKRMAMWQKARTELNSAHGSGEPVGLLEFVNDNCHSITIPFYIPPIAFDMARKREPFLMFSGISGTTEKPMTVASCMEFINVHVRGDKKNELGLRTEMTEADKEIVKGVAEPTNKKDSVRFLREKMERESLYARLPKFSF